MSEQARRVDSPALSPSALSSGLPFGIPAAYWLDLRTYQPAEAATALGKPRLIRQGGRVLEATVEEDLVTWQRGLAADTGLAGGPSGAVYQLAAFARR